MDPVFRVGPVKQLPLSAHHALHNGRSAMAVRANPVRWNRHGDGWALAGDAIATAGGRFEHSVGPGEMVPESRTADPVFILGVALRHICQLLAWAARHHSDGVVCMVPISVTSKALRAGDGRLRHWRGYEIAFIDCAAFPSGLYPSGEGVGSYDPDSDRGLNCLCARLAPIFA